MLIPIINSLQIKIRRKKNVKKGIQFCLMVCGASGTGTSKYGYTAFQLLTCSLQAELPLSTPFAERKFSKEKMPMMRQTRTSRKVSESSLLPLVRIKNFDIIYGYTGADNIIELELDEEGTRISLTIVDTPGFGDQIDNEAR
jgi:cell division control protein 11